VLAGIEKASGARPDTCPWQAFRDPFVAAVLRASRWKRDRQLAMLTGPHAPAALARGIEIYETALNATKSHDLREEAEERKRERERNTPRRPTPWGR